MRLGVLYLTNIKDTFSIALCCIEKKFIVFEKFLGIIFYVLIGTKVH